MENETNEHFHAFQSGGGENAGKGGGRILASYEGEEEIVRAKEKAVAVKDRKKGRGRGGGRSAVASGTDYFLMGTAKPH